MPRTSAPRLQLEPTSSRTTVLDGGWWPRSTDPAIELPAVCDFNHDRFDLLVIPPKSASGPAAAAMRAASDTGNTQHVPDLLARVGR